MKKGRTVRNHIYKYFGPPENIFVTHSYSAILGNSYWEFVGIEVDEVFHYYIHGEVRNHPFRIFQRPNAIGVTGLAEHNTIIRFQNSHWLLSKIRHFKGNHNFAVGFNTRKES